jgi:hypothetical protein
MPKQTLVNPARELRFRRTALAEGAAEVWMPIFRGRQSEHDFLGYYQARPTFEEAQQAAESGCYATGHELVGYARVRVEALQVVDLEPKAPEEPVDDEVPQEVAAE